MQNPPPIENTKLCKVLNGAKRLNEKQTSIPFFQINKRLLGLPDEAEYEELRVCEGWIISETKEIQVQ